MHDLDQQSAEEQSAKPELFNNEKNLVVRGSLGSKASLSTVPITQLDDALHSISVTLTISEVA